MTKNNLVIFNLLISILLIIIQSSQLPASFQDTSSVANSHPISYHRLNESSEIRIRKKYLGSTQKVGDSLVPRKITQNNPVEDSVLIHKIFSKDELLSVPDEALIPSLEYYNSTGEMKNVKEFANLQSQKGISSAFYLSALIAERDLEEIELKEREPLFKQAVESYTTAYNKAQAEGNSDIANRADKALKRLISNFREDQKDIDLFKETTLRWFSSKKQNTIIEKATPFFERSYTFEGKIKIVRAVSRIPLRDQDYILEKVLLYTSGIDDAEGRAAIIRAITSIPPQKMEDTLQKATPFLKDITNGVGKADVIRAMGKISSLQYLILEEYPYILKDVHDGKGKASIIMSLGNIPSQNSEEYMQKLLPLLESVPDGKGRAVVIKTLGSVPYKNLNKVIKSANRFENVRIGSNGQRKAEIIDIYRDSFDRPVSEDDTSEDTAS